MEVTVTMGADDFADFMKWRKERDKYEREIKEVGGNLKKLASKVLATLEECETEKEPVYKITNQGAAVELVLFAEEVF